MERYPDIITTVSRRFLWWKLSISYQGSCEGAAEEIALNIAKARTMTCDVLIIGRGGGSIEDLWAE